MERKEKRPLGRRRIRRLDATEAWKKWGFRKEGTANSVTCWVKDDKNSKGTTDRGDVEMMVTVMRATGAALEKEDGLTDVEVREETWGSGEKRWCIQLFGQELLWKEQKNVAVSEERDVKAGLFKRESRACFCASGTDQCWGWKRKWVSEPREERGRSLGRAGLSHPLTPDKGMILMNKLFVSPQAQLRTALWNIPFFPRSSTSL